MPTKKNTTTAKKATTATPVKRTRTTSRKVKPQEEMFVEEVVMTETAQPKNSLFSFNKKKTIRLIIGIFVVGVILYFIRSWFIVAIVNGRPIWRYSFDRQLEQQGGKQVLSNLETKMLIQQEADRRHITVSDKELADAQKQIEQSLASQNQTLSAALTARGMSMSDFRDQLYLQKLIEKLLGSQIAVSDTEINDFLAQNKDFLPQGMSDADASASAREQLMQQKVQTVFPTYLAGLQKNAKIIDFVSF